LPAPNLTGVAGSNYQELVLNRNFNDKYNVRVDHNFTDSFSIFGRWSYRKSNALKRRIFRTVGQQPERFRGYSQ
jgi:hypothetical protein